MTKKTALKEISALASVVRTWVRYDRTVPFRADISMNCYEGFMHIRTNICMSEKTKSLMATVGLVALICISTPVFAGSLDTAYGNAMVPYVVLKRGTVECGKPAGEHLAYKARLLEILGRIPNIDLISADQEIERVFEREAPRSARPDCSEALLERYQYALDKNAEMALQYLAEEVRYISR